MKERGLLPSCAFKINGSYLEDIVDGYHTINATGWELIGKDVETVETNGVDGAVIQSTRYPAREINVEFILRGLNWEQKRARFLQLMGALNKENAQIIFNGEPDKYLTGTIIADLDLEHMVTAESGTFKILCVDPFKYSVADYTETPTDGVFNVNYGGTYKSYPKFIVEFPLTLDANGNNTDISQCGYVGLATQSGAVLQFGDPEEKNLGNVEHPATNPLNKTFTSIADWTPNGGATLGSEYAIDGTAAVNASNKYVYASAYGSGSDFHGPTVAKTLTDATDATNWVFSFKQKFAATKKQFGCFQCLIYNNNNGTRTLLGGVNLVKTTKDTKTKLTVLTDANSKTYTVKCSKVGTSTITKEGSAVKFSIAGKNVTLQLSDGTLIANEIVFYFGKKGTKTAMGTNCVYNCSLKRMSYKAVEDVPNLFMPGDVLTIDTKDASVYLDSGDSENNAQTIGALGNDWETFTLEPGTNAIEIDFSDWTTTSPEATLVYKRVWL